MPDVVRPSAQKSSKSDGLQMFRYMVHFLVAASVRLRSILVTYELFVAMVAEIAAIHEPVAVLSTVCMIIILFES